MSASKFETSTYKDRWSSQKNYHSQRSKDNKRRHRIFQIYIGVTAVIVPALIAAPGVADIFPIILSITSGVATVIAAELTFKNNWLSSRLTLEGLKREKALFESDAGPYRNAKYPDALFAERCERIINAEVVAFSKLAEEDGKSSNNTTASEG